MQCEIEACGYVCTRIKHHGELHYDPRPNPLDGKGYWWIQNPRNEDELRGMTPMTGYLLIMDTLLVEAEQNRIRIT